MSWELADHVCRFCGSRILVRDDVYQCPTCGKVSRLKPHGICGCGILPDARPASARGRRQTLFRCGPNPEKTAQNPADITILCGDMPVAGTS